MEKGQGEGGVKRDGRGDIGIEEVDRGDRGVGGRGAQGRRWGGGSRELKGGWREMEGMEE